MNPSLNDIVFAPINAVSEANQRLSREVIRFLRDLSKSSDGTVLDLETIQIQYEQLRNSPLDQHKHLKETIGLDIPLLSLCPIGFLKVAKSKISFSVEVQNAIIEDAELKLYSSISSDSPYHPNINYEIEMESIASPEGLSRMVDELNLKAVPKLLKSIPVDETGNLLDKEEEKVYRQKNIFVKNERELTRKINKLQQLIEEEISSSGYMNLPDNPYDREDAEGIAAIEQDNIFIQRYRSRKAEYESKLKDLRDEQMLLL